MFLGDIEMKILKWVNLIYKLLPNKSVQCKKYMFRNFIG